MNGKTYMLIFAVGFFIYFLFLPYQFFADGSVRYHFINHIIQTGSIEQMKYSIIGPMISYPLALVDTYFGSNILLLHYNFFLLTISAYFFFVSLKNHAEDKTLNVFIVLLFFGSMFPGHIIHYYGEVFSALLMAAGIILIEKNKLMTGWICLILSTANTPATIFSLLAISFYKVFKQKNAWYILLPLLAGIVMLLDSKVRMPRTSAGFLNYLLDDKGFKTIMPLSGNPGFSYPMILGLLAEIFSFGKGLVFFAPGIFFINTIWKLITNNTLKRVLILWYLYLFGLLFTYSKWWAWYGGWFWGPRFLLFASIPSSFVLAFLLTQKTVSVKLKIIALGLSTWSLWIGLNGIIFQQSTLGVCTENNYALEHLCWYVPEFSVLFRPFIVRAPLAISDIILLVFSIVVFLQLTLVAFRTKK